MQIQQNLRRSFNIWITNGWNCFTIAYWHLNNSSWENILSEKVCSLSNENTLFSRCIKAWLASFANRRITPTLHYIDVNVIRKSSALIKLETILSANVRKPSSYPTMFEVSHQLYFENEASNAFIHLEKSVSSFDSDIGFYSASFMLSLVNEAFLRDFLKIGWLKPVMAMIFMTFRSCKNSSRFL